MTLKMDWRLVAWRYGLRVIRQPVILVLSILQPMMFMLLFRYVFGGAISKGFVGDGSYVSYLLPGIITQTVAFSSCGTALVLAEDINSGLIDRFRSMPMTRWAVLAGRLVFDIGNYLGVVLIMVAAGYVVGFRFLNGVVPAVSMIGLAIVFGLSMSCISAYIGMRFRTPQAVMSFGLIWLFPLCFISSAFVPILTMPGWLQAVAKANPVTIVIGAMRAMASGGPTGVRLVESLMWMALIAVVFVPLGVRAYKRAT